MEPALADRFRRAALLAAGTLMGALLCVSAPAQQQSGAPEPSVSGGHDMPTPDQLEPGVNTTPAAPAPASTPADAAAGAPPAARESAAPARPAAEPRPAAQPRPNTASPSAASLPGPAAPPKEPATAKNAARKSGPDRIELDTTDITGNRELPKVLYIVPWKHSDLGDLVGKPVNSLLDEVLQPLDRDVFQRENRYYDALKPGADGAKAGAAQGSDNKP
jgi:hypothetical protein